ncbi:uncharacterized protein H6S33_011839 [Morchella sextelata]|uniref:uncharacterized protein n=1 Tax=Morchella sextelata TaxID=1174677 RepID=UPI001D05A4C9|nr:uncharacterized protein H6S33_011839 [Morchella sextelata]KAH0610312.1 hypothetical protein H6S33_011839 [Morchella sextelata]
MYSDECTFDTSARGSAWVTRLPGERFHEDCIQYTFNSGRGSVHVWGAISYNWKSELVFLDGTGGKGICAKDYMEQVLEPIVAPAFMGLLDYDASTGGLYVEDRAPWHGTKKALVEVKKILDIPLHSRPAQSPDLNPIENVWRIMKQRIKARSQFPNTVKLMAKAIQEEWDRLESKDWNGFIDSMPTRLQEVKKRHGLITQY